MTDLLDRDTDMFGCLFGVQNFANFRPVAPARGLPPHLSPEAAGGTAQSQGQGEGSGFLGATWVSWAELDWIDWDERAEAPDGRVHKYVRDERGGLRYAGKAFYARDLARRLGLSLAEFLDRPPAFPEGTAWEIGGTLYRVETLTRRRALAASRRWPLLFALMRELAAHFGGYGARLVVWFDQ